MNLMCSCSANTFVKRLPNLKTQTLSSTHTKWQPDLWPEMDVCMPLTPMSLRVEDPDGLTVAEYRLWDDQVEMRHLPLSSEDEEGWYRLTPEDLASHVSRNTAIAHWLMRRLGWRRLLRACTREERVRYLDTPDVPAEHRAA